MRSQVIALACLRLGHPAASAEGARLLPDSGHAAAVAGPGTPAGLGRHHVPHASAGIVWGRLWRAVHWIGAVRSQVIALACLRLGHPAASAEGAHPLPEEVTGPPRATLVRAPELAELRRALVAAATALAREVARADPALAERGGAVSRSRRRRPR
ncbi:hypothetical protein [Actinacidiphila glaucinigra]|uniref:hypothetical protein n=1 Tax=Actinacidiphila glaucinigra TaxID=235986 RepID=UPI0035DFBEDA